MEEPITKPSKRVYSELSDKTCVYCGHDWSTHEKRCLDVVFDGEIRRCLLDAGHDGPHHHRPKRSRYN